jgi:hypothetical protein
MHVVNLFRLTTLLTFVLSFFLSEAFKFWKRVSSNIVYSYFSSFLLILPCISPLKFYCKSDLLRLLSGDVFQEYFVCAASSHHSRFPMYVSFVILCRDYQGYTGAFQRSLSCPSKQCSSKWRWWKTDRGCYCSSWWHSTTPETDAPAILVCINMFVILL